MAKSKKWMKGAAKKPAVKAAAAGAKKAHAKPRAEKWYGANG